MKHDTEHTENDNPVINAIFIGLYLVALIILLVVLARRFLPAVHSLLAM